MREMVSPLEVVYIKENRSLRICRDDGGGEGGKFQFAVSGNIVAGKNQVPIKRQFRSHGNPKTKTL